MTPPDDDDDTCPEDADLAAFVDGALSEPEHHAIDAHVDGCDACSAVLVGFARVFHAEAEADTLAAAGDPTVDALAPGTEVDRYVVRERVGQGGMGVVYLAHDREMDRLVALKLVRTSEGHARLRTEARALARLEHPNVVSVYDVGDFAGHVYVAMEYVVGVSLREWLTPERSRNDVLAMFLQAAQGLAAAHAAGVVHRDFKPANVMVGDDGRVRVVDFGLARVERSRRAGAKASEPPVSREGQVVGTPRYMPPEQRAGAAADARSDQYSFGLALKEALAPFPRLPRRLARALGVSLQTEPARRHRDMRALCAALEAALQPPRARAMIAAIAAMALVAMGLLYVSREAPRPPICQVHEATFAGVWDADTREHAEDAFNDSGLSRAADTFERVARKLDDYREGWLAQRELACAAETRSGAPDAGAELWLACLESRRAEARVLVAILVKADAAVVDRAVVAVGELEPPERCAMHGQSPTLVPLSPEHLAIERDVARVRTLSLMGQLPEAADLAAAAVKRARALEHGPLLARALGQLGSIRAMRDDLAGAEQALVEAARVADQSADDEARVEAYAALAEVEARRDEPSRGLLWLDLAEGARLRGGARPELEQTIVSVRAKLLGGLAQFEESLVEQERAVAVSVSVNGEESYRTGIELMSLALALHQRGRHEEARAQFQRAGELLGRVLGAGHPLVGQLLLEAALEDGGTLDIATTPAVLEMAHEGHAILTTAFPPEHKDRIWADIALAQLLAEGGQTEKARPIAVDAFVLARKTLGDDDVQTAMARVVVGQCWNAAGKHIEARAMLARAIAQLGATPGRRARTSLGHAHAEMGRVHIALGNPTAAAASFDESRAIFAAASPDHQRARYATRLRDAVSRDATPQPQ